MIKKISLVLVLVLYFITATGYRKTKPQPCAILLLHGLGAHTQQFDTLKKAIEKKIPHAQIVAPTSLAGDPSFYLSIDQQAEAVFIELKETIPHYKDTPLLCIGHSQGGLRGYALLQHYAHTLNIKGLVTIATPWEGAPAINVTTETVTKLLTPAVHEDVIQLATYVGCTAHTLTTTLLARAQENEQIRNLPGVQDLIPGSTFLKKVAISLPHHTTPILAIAAGQSNLATIAPTTVLKGKLHALNHCYARLVVGDHPDQRHDMVVPVYSQHASTLLSKRHSNFRRAFFADAYHSPHVLGITVPHQRKISIQHDKIIQAVVKFAKKYVS